MNEELVLATEQLRLRRPDDPWLIPIRFDDCDVPDLDLGGGRTLASIQRVDLFGTKREIGIERLVTAVVRILGRSNDRQSAWQTGDARLGEEIDDSSTDHALAMSGQNSKVVEVNLPKDRYLVKWKRSDSKNFGIKDESARGGKGFYLLQELSSDPNSGGEGCPYTRGR